MQDRRKRKIAVPPYRDMQLADLPGEQWRDIPGLEGYGMVSNFGRVKRLAYDMTDASGRVFRFEERIQAQKVQYYSNGFVGDRKCLLQSRIQVGGVTHSLSVGRIVYCCFVESFDLSDRSVYITYRDGNGLGPLPGNLIKTDLAGLQQIIMRSGRKDLHFGHSEANQKVFAERGRLVNIKEVSRYDMEGRFVATHESLSAAALAVGINLSAISSVTTGKNLTAGGYIWRLGKGKKRIPVKHIHRAIRDTKGAPVSRYGMDGRKIATYYNMTQAAKAVGAGRKIISEAANGHILIAAGSVWRKGEAEYADTAKEQRSLSLRKGYTISRYNLDGEKLATFKSSKEAAKAAGVAPERVNAMAIRDDLLLKGSIWRYGDAEMLGAEEVARVQFNLQKEKSGEVTQYNLGGRRLRIFPSMTAAARATGVPRGAIGGSVNGHKATGGGFIWRQGKGGETLAIPPTPRPLGGKLAREVYQYDLDGKFIGRYPTIREASRALGVNPASIGAALRGDIHTAGGFVWKLERMPGPESST